MKIKEADIVVIFDIGMNGEILESNYEEKEGINFDDFIGDNLGDLVGIEEGLKEYFDTKSCFLFNYNYYEGNGQFDPIEYDVCFELVDSFIIEKDIHKYYLGEETSRDL